MELVVKSRGDKVSSAARQRIEEKVSKLTRFNGHIQRVEIEIIKEAAPKVQGGHRVEGAAWTGRKTFRASAAASDLDAAVEGVVDRLERQITDDHGRRRARMIEGANRVKSDDRSGQPSEPEEA